MGALRTEHGFQFGSALVESFAVLPNGGVCVGIMTPKERMQVHVTKSGLIRVTREAAPGKVKVQD